MFSSMNLLKEEQASESRFRIESNIGLVLKRHTEAERIRSKYNQNWWESIWDNSGSHYMTFFASCDILCNPFRCFFKFFLMLLLSTYFEFFLYA